MRHGDFRVMRECWMFKDVQGWAEVAATVLSTATSTAAMAGLRGLGAKGRACGSVRVAGAGGVRFYHIYC